MWDFAYHKNLQYKNVFFCAIKFNIKQLFSDTLIPISQFHHGLPKQMCGRISTKMDGALERCLTIDIDLLHQLNEIFLQYRILA